jgi:A/G-specific adenine glycosylase
VWVSEIMLQQTQVATVVPYFARFMARFPGVRALATAKLDDVLALWAGLGYYARARNLHRAAQLIVTQHGGEFPRDVSAALELPGIGRSTAGAILAQAYGQRHAILDANVRRVLARHAAIKGWPGEPAVAEKLWAVAQAHLPKARLADYTQALMDLGATLCTARTPRCGQCPVAKDCRALALEKVHAFPWPRPTRARPARAARLLLIENARGELLLERRAERGIWGGLWCPPVLDLIPAKAAPDVMPANAGIQRYSRLRVIEQLAPVHHAFTHFDLTLTPVRLRASGRAGAGSKWIARKALPRYGLPAPVRRLLVP